MNFKLIITVVLVILGVFLASSINKLPTLDEEVKAAWSQVENQYKRRFDLVPNLVKIVQGYAKHENNTLNQVVEARSKVSQITLDASSLNNPQKMAEFQKGQAALGSALGRLMAISERYPDLKANQNFLELQSQLEGTENRIAVARRDYILAIQNYNTALRTFPTIIWAKLIYRDLTPKANFTEEKSIHEAPQVSL